MSVEIKQYNERLPGEYPSIGALVATTIDDQLAESEKKIWHGHPVWFLEGNPIVGYSLLKDGLRVLFWSGQSFEEPGLTPEGSFKASEIRYRKIGDVDLSALKQYLIKAKDIQWDYKNLVKRKGKLERLK